jgi:D-alanyl-D-alanine dipeptidase
LLYDKRVKLILLATLSLSALTACTTTSKPVEKSTETPTVSTPSDLVALKDIDPTIVQDIRYATIHNFIGRPIKGYSSPHCLLTRDAAVALSKVQSELKAKSLSLKVYDCYRPQRAVDDFVAWAKDLSDVKMKKEFYPKVDKSKLFKDGYIAEKSGHSRGSTVDLTIVPLPPPSEAVYKEGQKLKPCTFVQGSRFADGSVDMGTGYDCFDPLAHTENPSISATQKWNRHLLKSTMEKYGFKNLDEEWWHFTLKNEPFPDRYNVSLLTYRGPNLILLPCLLKSATISTNGR